jgi:hypothetical protein
MDIKDIKKGYKGKERHKVAIDKKPGEKIYQNPFL